MKYNHLDLFSGIGGFALAARWAGIETVRFVEIDPFCQKVLQKNFPGVPIHEDIKTFKWTGERPFILTGGFPCQPFSTAGKRRGKEDDRYLWPEMLRVVSEAKPAWVIGENVAGFIGMGLDDCISGLEDQGYEVQAFVIPACAVNAPHRRDRVWIVADNNGQRQQANGWKLQPIKPQQFVCCDVRNTKSTRQQSGPYRPWEMQHGGTGAGENWPEVAARLCRVDDGLPRQVDRVNRLKALGNAIVPQIPYLIMKAILEIENQEV